jgi:outer membrane protein TolC
MLRRLRWMVIGAGMGLGGSWWARRKARRAAATLAPAEMGRRMVAGASRRVQAARQDARLARADTERRLKGGMAADRHR